jgi:hypothetical protein
MLQKLEFIFETVTKNVGNGSISDVFIYLFMWFMVLIINLSRSCCYSIFNEAVNAACTSILLSKQTSTSPVCNMSSSVPLQKTHTVKCVYFFVLACGASAKLRKANTCFVTCQPTWSNSSPTVRISMKFYVWEVFENLSRKFEFH